MIVFDAVVGSWVIGNNRKLFTNEIVVRTLEVTKARRRLNNYAKLS